MPLSYDARSVFSLCSMKYMGSCPLNRKNNFAVLHVNEPASKKKGARTRNQNPLVFDTVVTVGKQIHGTGRILTYRYVLKCNIVPLITIKLTSPLFSHSFNLRENTNNINVSIYIDQLTRLQNPKGRRLQELI